MLSHRNSGSNTFHTKIMSDLGLIIAINIATIAFIGLFIFLGTMNDIEFGTSICNLSKGFVDYITDCATQGMLMVAFYLINAVTNLLELGYVLLMICFGINNITNGYLKRIIGIIFTLGFLCLPIFFNMGLGFIQMIYVYDNVTLRPEFICNQYNIIESLTVSCMMRGLYPVGFILMGINLLIGLIVYITFCIKKCRNRNRAYYVDDLE